MKKALAPLLAAFAVVAAVLSAPIELRAEEFNKEGFEYIGTQADGTTFLAKVKRRIDYIVIIESLILDDPEQDGKEYSWFETINCSTRLRQRSNGQWVPFPSGSIGEILLLPWACDQ